MSKKQSIDNTPIKQFICDNPSCKFQWQANLNQDQNPDICPKCYTHSTYCKNVIQTQDQKIVEEIRKGYFKLSDDELAIVNLLRDKKQAENEDGILLFAIQKARSELLGEIEKTPSFENGMSVGNTSFTISFGQWEELKKKYGEK